MSGPVDGAIQRLLEEVGVTGFVHARAIDHADREVALRADEPVVMASVFKIAVCLELFRQAAAGEVDLAERHLVAAASRSPGPVGLSFMEHDAELSLVDLAYLMMAVSDNAATDVVIARVGLERINATLRSLGLERTVLAGDCADIGQTSMDAVGASSPDDLPPLENPPDGSKNQLNVESPLLAVLAIVEVLLLQAAMIGALVLFIDEARRGRPWADRSATRAPGSR